VHRRKLLRRVEQERCADDEVREALLGLLLRVVDEYRFGLRELSTEELSDVVRAWGTLNAGETPTEAVLRLDSWSRNNR
jgi:hypothetical protein